MRGSGRGQFDIVHGIAIDAPDNVYVGDEGNKRVQVFESEGAGTQTIRQRRKRSNEFGLVNSSDCRK